MNTASADQFFKTIRDNCGALELPRLRTLIINRTVDSEFMVDGVVDNVDLHLYSSWDMPALENLHITGFIPHHCFGASLLSCSIFLENEVANVTSLFNFLGTLTRLRELELRLITFDESSWPDASINLSSLRKLKIDFGRSEPYYASKFVSLLDIPNISDLHLSASVAIWTHLHTLLDCFRGGKRYESLRSFTIDLKRNTAFFDQFINMMFESFPNLEHFDISAYDKLNADASSVVQCPPLKTLRFRECNAFNGSVMSRILERLDRCGRLEKFKKLEVVDCPTFEFSKVDKLIKSAKLKGKIDWKNYCY